MAKKSKRKMEDWVSEIYGNNESFAKKYNSLTGRELAIVAAAVLDIGLAHLIERKLRNDKEESESILGMNGDGRAAIGSFGARIQLAYLITLIDKRELGVIRIFKKIRNEFAHTVNCTFLSKEIQDLVSKLIEDYFFVSEGIKNKERDKLYNYVKEHQSKNEVVSITIFTNMFKIIQDSFAERMQSVTHIDDDEEVKRSSSRFALERRAKK